MEGFACLVAPVGRQERQRWFPLAGWVPEPWLGQAGRLIPWRMLIEFSLPDAGPAPAPRGAVVALAASADGFRRWEAARRRQYLIRLVEELSSRGLRLFGLGRGFRGSPEATEPVREAVSAVWGGEGAGVVEEWVGRLAGGLTAAEFLASTRNWDGERTEVVVSGGETSGGRVAARFLARRFGRLSLVGDSPALTRLVGHLLHETGTAARVVGRWSHALSRADLVVLAGPLPPGAADALRPETVVLELAPGSTARREGIIAGALLTWPAGPPTAGLPGAVWTAGEHGEAGVAGPNGPGPRPLVADDLAAVAAVGIGAGPGRPARAEEVRRLAGNREPSLGGVLAVHRAWQESGFRPVATLDKAGTVLL
jgi:hypothetical protein